MKLSLVLTLVECEASKLPHAVHCTALHCIALHSHRTASAVLDKNKFLHFPDLGNNTFGFDLSTHRCYDEICNQHHRH